MWTIRDAEERDRNGALAVWQAAGMGGVTADEFPQLLASPALTMLVAEEDGTIIGLTIGSYDGYRATIYQIVVPQQQRGRGLGRELIAALEARLSGEEGRYVYILIRPDYVAGLRLASVAGYYPTGDVVLVKAPAEQDVGFSRR